MHSITGLFRKIAGWLAWVFSGEELAKQPVMEGPRQRDFFRRLFAGERLERALEAEQYPDRRDFLTWLITPEKLERLPQAGEFDDRGNFVSWFFTGETLETKPVWRTTEKSFLRNIF